MHLMGPQAAAAESNVQQADQPTPIDVLHKHDRFRNRACWLVSALGLHVDAVWFLQYT